MQKSHAYVNQDGSHPRTGANMENHVDNYDLFLVALRNRLTRKEKTQVDIARDAGITANFLSLVMKGKRRLGDDKREAVAKVFGVSAREFINEGHLVTYGRPVEQSPAQHPVQKPVAGVEAGYVNPLDVVAAMSSASSAVSLLAKQCQEENGKKQFWRAAFDEMPIAAIIIKDGLVWYQNIKASDWGDIKNVTLCESCACPDDCKKKHECPSYQAIETRNAKSGYQYIGKNYYKVDVIPLKVHYKEHKYFLIFATEASEIGDNDRRLGDRRKDKQEGEE